MSFRSENPEDYAKIKERLKTLIKYRDKIDNMLSGGGLFNPKVAITATLKDIILEELPEDLDNKEKRVEEILKRVEKEILGAM